MVVFFLSHQKHTAYAAGTGFVTGLVWVHGAGIDNLLALTLCEHRGKRVFCGKSDGIKNKKYQQKEQGGKGTVLSVLSYILNYHILVATGWAVYLASCRQRYRLCRPTQCGLISL